HEVQVDWRRYALANNVDLFTRLFGGQHCARQRSQRSALRGGDHQLGIHRTRHRRQHDREFCLDEVEETAVRPHGFSLWFGLVWLGGGDEIAASEQELFGFGDEALHDLGG